MTDEDKALVEWLREMGEHPCRVDFPIGASLRDAADRIETQAAEIKTILDREADTHRRHDAKVDALETALREVLADDEALMDITWRDRAYAALGDKQ